MALWMPAGEVCEVGKFLRLESALCLFFLSSCLVSLAKQVADS